MSWLPGHYALRDGRIVLDPNRRDSLGVTVRRGGAAERVRCEVADGHTVGAVTGPGEAFLDRSTAEELLGLGHVLSIGEVVEDGG